MWVAQLILMPFVYWIVIYLGNRTIQPVNNWDQVTNFKVNKKTTSTDESGGVTKVLHCRKHCATH